MYRDHLSGRYCYFVPILKTRRSGPSGSGMFPEGGTVLINLHNNSHHLISHCCCGNKYKNPRWPPLLPSWIFEILLNIETIC